MNSPPYAAGLGGLLERDFVAIANDYLAGTTGDNFKFWASQLKAKIGDMKIRLEDLQDLQQGRGKKLRRGDLVLFYKGDDEGVQAIHMAIGTGDSDMVYSLWNIPDHCLSKVSASYLWEKSPLGNQPYYIKTATPGWHTVFQNEVEISLCAFHLGKWKPEQSVEDAYHRALNISGDQFLRMQRDDVSTLREKHANAIDRIYQGAGLDLKTATEAEKMSLRLRLIDEAKTGGMIFRLD